MSVGQITGGTKRFNSILGSQSVCAIRTLLGVELKIHSISNGPLILNALNIYPQLEVRNE